MQNDSTLANSSEFFRNEVILLNDYKNNNNNNKHFEMICIFICNSLWKFILNTQFFFNGVYYSTENLLQVTMKKRSEQCKYDKNCWY